MQSAGLAAAHCSGGSCGAAFSSGIMRELQHVVAVVRQDYQIPRIAVAVTVPGEGCWVSASGLANTASGAPLQLSDEFPVGSITKTFTATVILQLVQQGKLSLSAPLSRWLPYVQDARRITIKMLLGMTSGIYSEPAGQLAQQRRPIPAGYGRRSRSCGSRSPTARRARPVRPTPPTPTTSFSA
jgi:CubicO group peptidase (beta-lactamase class C family)